MMATFCFCGDICLRECAPEFRNLVVVGPAVEQNKREVASGVGFVVNDAGKVVDALATGRYTMNFGGRLFFPILS